MFTNSPMNKKLFGQWKLTACLSPASVLRWLLGMGCFRFWGLHVGGNGVLFFAMGKKYKKNYKTFLILISNPTCVFSL
jgi:hypothetical protein